MLQTPRAWLLRYSASASSFTQDRCQAIQTDIAQRNADFFEEGASRNAR